MSILISRGIFRKNPVVRSCLVICVRDRSVHLPDYGLCVLLLIFSPIFPGRAYKLTLCPWMDVLYLLCDCSGYENLRYLTV